MSTGLECNFVEWEPGKWYYVLEDDDAPKNAWDWMEYATAYGPFSSFDAAYDHLDNNHPNPGGYSEHSYHESIKENNTLAKLIAEATIPKRHLPFGFRF